MIAYAICDKFGIVSLQTKSTNDVITSSTIMIYADAKRAREKLQIIKQLYDMDEFYIKKIDIDLLQKKTV